jgi:hypothetical protein
LDYAYFFYRLIQAPQINFGLKKSTEWDLRLLSSVSAENFRFIERFVLQIQSLNLSRKNRPQKFTAEQLEALPSIPELRKFAEDLMAKLEPLLKGGKSEKLVDAANTTIIIAVLVDIPPQRREVRSRIC